MLSFPAPAGCAVPTAAAGIGEGGGRVSGAQFPSPSHSRLGRLSPPAARRTLPRVSLPASPYAAVSWAAPIPRPSSTTIAARRAISVPGALDEPEAQRGERLAQQLRLVRLEPAGGLALQHREGVGEGLGDP